MNLPDFIRRIFSNRPAHFTRRGYYHPEDAHAFRSWSEYLDDSQPDCW